MKSKYRIQVVRNPASVAEPSKNTAINNPRTGTPVFGTFPEIPDLEFDEGPIYLRYGEHLGPRRGFGLKHIWQAHFPRILTLSEATDPATSLVSSVLVSGAAIHYEYGLGSAGRRSTVFRSSAGVVIVERMLNGRNQVFYSIVTAFPTQRVQGALIGTLT